MKKLCAILMCIFCVPYFFPQSSFALDISGSGTLGSFTDTFTYSSTDDQNATLIITLTNTSPAANTGFVTALAFNIPSVITGVSLSATNTNFEFLNGVSAPPIGSFDIGASTGMMWTGGGAPSNRIAVGATETFTFTLPGTGLDGLSTQDF